MIFKCMSLCVQDREYYALEKVVYNFKVLLERITFLLKIKVIVAVILFKNYISNKCRQHYHYTKNEVFHKGFLQYM